MRNVDKTSLFSRNLGIFAAALVLQEISVFKLCHGNCAQRSLNLSDYCNSRDVLFFEFAE